MRAARLVNMLLMLQARERVTATEMAKTLEVSVRTVHRDIEALAEAGVPVYAERGARGGFRILGTRRFALAGLTASEAEAVHWVGLPAVTRAFGLEHARQAAQQVLIDLDDTPEPRLLRGLRRAIGERRAVHVRLHGASEMRDYSPLGLVWSGGGWHLVAREVQRGGVTAIGFDEIDLVRTSAAPPGAHIAPPGFDLAATWSALRSSRPEPAGNSPEITELKLT